MSINNIRRFTHVDGFSDSTTAINFEGGVAVSRTIRGGEVISANVCHYPLASALEFVRRGVWKEIFQAETTRYLIHRDGPFGPLTTTSGFGQSYYVKQTGKVCTAVNADGTIDSLEGLAEFVDKFVTEGDWKVVTEEQAKAALKPTPKVRRFQHKSGPFGQFSGDHYHFESDKNGKCWWVYASGDRLPAESYRTLERALERVEDGDWVEIVGTGVPPVEAKASPIPKCSDFFIVGRKFGPFSTFGDAQTATLAANELAKNEKFPVYIFKPIKSYTLVQPEVPAPTVVEKTL